MQGYMYHYVYALGMRAPRPDATNVYLTPELKAAVDAARGLTSRSEWIRRAVHEALTKEAGR